MILPIVLTYLLTPALIIWLCTKVPFLNKIGPVLLLYLIGIILGNSGIIPHSAYPVQDLLVTVIIPLAIPMMLFSCNFKQWDVKNAFMTLLTGVVAVVVAIILGYIIFKPLIGRDPLIGDQMHNIAGMLAGVYTGGTPNLAAIKIMLGIPNETYIMIHSYDMAISLLYLTFLLSVGIKFFRRILYFPPKNGSTVVKNITDEGTEENPYRDIFSRKHFVPLLATVGLSLLIFAVSGGLSFIFPKDMQTVVVILSITTLGIAASFIKPVREIKKSYDAGMYLVYVFSIVVASMADISRLNLTGGLYVLLYIAFVIFGSLAFQLLMARFFKLDADSVVIASVALINSPPFVPLIATAMKNKGVIITGLTVGLIGYALGNYLGYIISKILFIYG